MRFSLWAWLFWAVPIYLAMEVGAFLIIGLAFKKSIGELITPFLAFAVPALIFFPLVWWLRILEKQGTSPKRLARGWVSSTALFLIAAMAATFYSGIHLRLMDSNGAMVVFAVASLFCIPSLYFGMYRRTLEVISTRAAAGKADHKDYK